MKVKQILEAATEPGKKLTVLHQFQTVEQIVAFMKEHCSDILARAVAANDPFWRGTMDRVDMAVVDPTVTERRSENTSNIYTLVFDRHPERANWPKRSRSLICTTNANYASSYGKKYAVIPINDCPIGAVNRDDIWNTELKNFQTSLYVMNQEIWDRILGEVYDWNDLNRLHDKLASTGVPKDLVEELDSLWGDHAITLAKLIDSKGLIPTLFALYSNKNLSPAHTFHTTKTVDRIKPGEVWIGGPCLMLEYSTWLEVRKAFGVPV